MDVAELPSRIEKVASNVLSGVIHEIIDEQDGDLKEVVRTLQRASDEVLNTLPMDVTIEFRRMIIAQHIEFLKMDVAAAKEPENILLHPMGVLEPYKLDWER